MSGIRQACSARASSVSSSESCAGETTGFIGWRRRRPFQTRRGTGPARTSARRRPWPARRPPPGRRPAARASQPQSRRKPVWRTLVVKTNPHLVCRLLLEKKKQLYGEETEEGEGSSGG